MDEMIMQDTITDDVSFCPVCGSRSSAIAHGINCCEFCGLKFKVIEVIEED